MNQVRVDAHTHLAFLGSLSEASKTIAGLQQQGVTHFIQGGYDSADWQQQLELKAHWSKTVICCFGLHPWVVAESDRTELDLQWKTLTQLAPKAEFLGEIGLDFHRAEAVSQKTQQEIYFKQQLALASDLNKPIALHVVKAHEQVLRELSTHKLRGFIHGFSGSPEVARIYLKQGFKISIGPGILNPHYKKLQATVLELATEDLVIESDYPADKAPVPIRSQYLFYDVAEKVAQLKNVRLDDLLRSSSQTLLDLIEG